MPVDVVQDGCCEYCRENDLATCFDSSTLAIFDPGTMQVSSAYHLRWTEYYYLYLNSILADVPLLLVVLESQMNLPRVGRFH